MDVSQRGDRQTVRAILCTVRHRMGWSRANRMFMAQALKSEQHTNLNTHRRPLMSAELPRSPKENVQNGKMRT